MKRVLLGLMLAASAGAAQQYPAGDAGPGYSRDEVRIASVVQGANRGALAVAGVAAKRAKDPDVKAFARHLLMSRQELGGAFDSLASLRGYPAPQASDVDALQTEAEERARSLAGMEGDAHDDFFLDWAVDHSRRLTDRVDESLKSVSEPRVRDYLTKLRDAALSDAELAAQLRTEAP